MKNIIILWLGYSRKLSMSFYYEPVSLLMRYFCITGGCSSFGHSCYGGHGKRSVVPSIVDANNEVEQGTYSAPSRLIKILQQGNDDQVVRTYKHLRTFS